MREGLGFCRGNYGDSVESGVFELCRWLVVGVFEDNLCRGVILVEMEGCAK